MLKKITLVCKWGKASLVRCDQPAVSPAFSAKQTKDGFKLYYMSILSGTLDIMYFRYLHKEPPTSHWQSRSLKIPFLENKQTSKEQPYNSTDTEFKINYSWKTPTIKLNQI